MVSNVQISDSFFNNNLNIVFSLIESGTSLKNVSIFNHKCNEFMVGCVISSVQKSSMICSNLHLKNVTNFKEEGNIYLEDSSSLFTNISFENLDNFKNKGNCFDLKNSNISINNGSFSTYTYNCFYALQSRVLINDSNFNNKEEFVLGIKYDTYIKYGAIFCQSCIEFTMQNSFILYNLKAFEGGALAFRSDLQEIVNLTVFLLNNSFVGNKARDSGGAISISNVNANIKNCVFSNNEASVGAGIYFESLCKIKNI